MGRKALLDGDSETVILSCCAPVQRVAGGCVAALDYRCEAAGWAFTRRYEAGEADEASESSDADATPSGGAEDYGREKEKKAAAGYLKISELLKGVQLYELMGISEGASQEEIKKAYRTLALSAHPDKQAAMEPEEAKKVEENFIKIQEAYELLSDPVKRKQYDSSLDFDDALPRLRKGDDFFKVFGEAFRRNARFSAKRPVPELGAKEDEPKVWKRFYDFWDNFQSWRDPVMLAQKAGEEICDLAEAECREERRWMVRENERVARKYKQQERERIAKLVSLAESSDPRVQAEKDAKRLAREAEQAKREEERNAVRRAKEEAEKRQREEEEAKQRALEQKRKEEKAAREAVKERVKKCRQRLRGFHQAFGYAVREHVVLEQLNEVCVQLSEEELRALGDQLELALKAKAVEKAVRLLHEAIEAIGLVPMKVQVEEASTTSGPGSEEDNTQRRLSPEEEELERQRQAEKARLAAERAEEKKKKEEQRKKEQAAAEAAKRQQEKKEEQKAKKASEKQKKQEEQDKLRKEQQREESRLKAQEQSERDKQLAQQKKQEMELERAVQAFSQDRVSRLTRLEALSDEQLLAQLAEATEADATLGAALQLLKASGDVEKGMALVHHIGVAWGLGLQAPLRMENAVRNRVKKGRKRLTDSLAAFLKASETFEGTATAWQRGIVEGSIEVPVWEPAEEAEEAPKEAPKEKKKAKKEKNDEDLDQILAGLDTPAKGSKKSKKK